MDVDAAPTPRTPPLRSTGDGATLSVAADFSVAFASAALGLSLAVAAADGDAAVVTVRCCDAGSDGADAGVAPRDVVCTVNSVAFADVDAMLAALRSGERPLVVGFKRPGGYISLRGGDKKEGEEEEEEEEEAAGRAGGGSPGAEDMDQEEEGEEEEEEEFVFK